MTEMHLPQDHRSRCLYVEASPRGPGSTSTAAAQAFLNELTSRQLNIAIDRLDVWSAGLPEFTGATIAAKYATLAGRALGEDQASAWRTISDIVERLRTADSLVISTPMWNFGIPYKLKHWIDLITQPGLTFSFDPATGYAPLLQSKPALVILSSAGDYANGPSRGRPDLATPYLREALKFIGLRDVVFVRIGPTAGTAEQTTAATETAKEALRELAKSFIGRLP